jgi:hypothetical protein
MTARMNNSVKAEAINQSQYPKLERPDPTPISELTIPAAMA